jgi:NAD(P)-dependent dehydrogenase (short-subunit alcohol dehydrogenase family)
VLAEPGRGGDIVDEGVADRVIIVTGAGAGIGRGLARHLARAGASVVAAEWKPDLLAGVVDEMEEAGLTCLGVECNVQERASIESMVAAAHERFGRIDGLVNNAMTISKYAALMDLSDESFDTDFTSGVKGTLWAMKAVYPHMKAAGWGRIVNVGSSAGIIGFKGMGAYGAAKEAIRSLTRTAAREWAVDGIVVNLYCPVSTGHHEGTGALVDEYSSQAMDVLAALSPYGYDGNAETDLGPVVAFLCSDASRYLTGQTLMLDGGIYAFA